MQFIGEIFRPYPKILYLEPVFGCNYACFSCIHGSGRHIQRIILEPHDFERLKPLVEKVSHIHLTGLGEPLLNPHLQDYVSYFRERGKSFYINTNGSLIDDRLVELMSGSKSELSVSLDAGDRETYQRMRHPAMWDTVISALRSVSRIKAVSRSPYPLLYLTFHINAVNVRSLARLPDLVRGLGVEAVRFSWTILPQAHRAHSVFRNQEMVTELMLDVSTRLHQMGIHVRCDAAFRDHVRGCWDLSPMTFIGANGTVAACCSRWLTIGSIRENRFEDIWNGMPRRRISLANVNKSPDERCEDCPQTTGVDYLHDEEAFFRPLELDERILAEKAGKPEKLPCLEGLDDAFQAGASSFLTGDLHGAVRIFAALEDRFPEFFEIKNNLAVCHHYLGNIEKCREIIHNIKSIPHNERILLSNERALQGPGESRP